MRKKQLITSVILSAMLLTVMSGCGGGGSTTTNETREGYVYVPNYVELPGEVVDLYNPKYYEGEIYFTQNIKIGEETVPMAPGITFDKPMARRTIAPEIAEEVPGGDESESSGEYIREIYGTRLFSIKRDGTGYRQIAYTPTEKPDNAEGSIELSDFIIDSEGMIWVLEGGYLYSYDEEGNYQELGNPQYVRKLNRDGKELASLDLTPLLDGQPYYNINNIVTDGNGMVLFTDSNSKVQVFNENSGYVGELKVEGYWIYRLVQLGSGKIGALLNKESGGMPELRELDTEMLTVNTEVILSSYNIYNMIPGDAQYTAYYYDQNNLYGIKAGSTASEIVLNWINSDMDMGSTGVVTILPNGEIICVQNNWSETGSSTELVTLVKTDASTITPKTVMTLACLWMDYNLRREIISFNKTNAKYRIEVQDYSVYNTDDNYNAGLTKLNTELISGKIPDMLLVEPSLPLRQYSAKGLLEDLYTYIDSDPVLNRDSLVTGVLKAMEDENGALRQIAPGFSIMTMISNAKFAGTEPGWSFDDLNALVNEAPDDIYVFSQYTTRDTIMNQFLSMNMEEYVNWDTGICSFDKPGFAQLLEFAARFVPSDEFDYNKINWEDESALLITGRQLAQEAYISDIYNFMRYRAMLGDDLVFKGYPCDSKNGNALMTQTGIAMTSKCKDKDGAWEFMRRILDETYQDTNTWYFPTNKQLFDKRVAEAMQPDSYTSETGEVTQYPRFTYYFMENSVELDCMTQEDVDILMKLIESTDRMYMPDQNIMNIINDDTAAFFAGQRNAVDTAALIQGRVTIYINEQR